MSVAHQIDQGPHRHNSWLTVSKAVLVECLMPNCAQGLHIHWHKCAWPVGVSLSGVSLSGVSLSGFN